jgi:hypothetical protein
MALVAVAVVHLLERFLMLLI